MSFLCFQYVIKYAYNLLVYFVSYISSLLKNERCVFYCISDLRYYPKTSFFLIMKKAPNLLISMLTEERF